MLSDGFTLAGSAKTGGASQHKMDNPEDPVSAEGVEQQAEETAQKKKKARKAREGKSKCRSVEEELLEEDEPYDKR